MSVSFWKCYFPDKRLATPLTAQSWLPTLAGVSHWWHARLVQTCYTTNSWYPVNREDRSLCHSRPCTMVHFTGQSWPVQGTLVETRHKGSISGQGEAFLGTGRVVGRTGIWQLCQIQAPFPGQHGIALGCLAPLRFEPLKLMAWLWVDPLGLQQYHMG